MNACFNQYVKKTKVDLSGFLGESHFVEIREPSTGDMKIFFRLQRIATKVTKDGNDEGYEEMFDVLEKMKDILPGLIVDHDFYDAVNKTKKVDMKEVSDFICSKFDILQFVVGELMKLLPLATGNGKK